MLEQIIDRVYHRREQWHTEEVPSLPSFENLKETTIIGSYSFAMLTSRRRLIKLPTAIAVDGTCETPPSLAKDYLSIRFGTGPPIKHNQSGLVKAYRQMPILAKPCQFVQGFYVDIASTYWQIMNIVGWDVDYFPGHWLAQGIIPDDFPWPDHKVARICLVSAGIARQAIVYQPDKGKTIEIAKGNPLANFQLYSLITDVLNAIAGQISALKSCVYVNTDGYILTDIDETGRAISIISDWGLEARIKHYGQGWVRGPGDYCVGRHKSDLSGYKPQQKEKIDKPPYTPWLQRQFEHFASKMKGYLDRRTL